jgi:hypothetical protein
MERLHLQYGTDGLELVTEATDVTVIRPRFVDGLADEPAAFREAVRRPIGARPLRDLIGARDRVAVVIPDITRPMPSDRLLPWLFAELAHVPARNVTIINGTGSHRPNTPAELERMVGAPVASTYRIVNHAAQDPSGLLAVGTAKGGRPVFLNRAYVEADRRIVVGFIEPHFMAGFSGGYKGIFPALADIDALMRVLKVDQPVKDPTRMTGDELVHEIQDLLKKFEDVPPLRWQNACFLQLLGLAGILLEWRRAEAESLNFQFRSYIADMDRPGYDADLVLWAEDQADALRRAAAYTQATRGRPAISRRTLRGRRVDARRAGITPRTESAIGSGKGAQRAQQRRAIGARGRERHDHRLGETGPGELGDARAAERLVAHHAQALEHARRHPLHGAGAVARAPRRAHR